MYGTKGLIAYFNDVTLGVVGLHARDKVRVASGGNRIFHNR